MINRPLVQLLFLCSLMIGLCCSTVSAHGSPLKPKAPQPRKQKSARPTTDLYKWLMELSASLHPSLRGKLVVIDAGHGGSDPGACRNGVKESDITLSIAMRLKKTLEARGAKVILTRSKDEDVELQPRVDMTNSVRPDVFISVHVNAQPNRQAQHGFETWFRMDCSRMFAHTMQAVVVRELPVNDAKVHTARFWVINYTDIPSVLLEVGFITNTTERGMLVCNWYQWQMAEAIADGLTVYWSKKGLLKK